MSGEHYFSEQPAGEFKTKTITTAIAGERVELFTAGSVFSPDHMDTGTAILLEHSGEAPNQGNLLDLGCGWGANRSNPGQDLPAGDNLGNRRE